MWCVLRGRHPPAGGGGVYGRSVSGSGLTLEPADARAVLRTIRRPGSVTALTGRVGNWFRVCANSPGSRHPPGKCVPTLEPVATGRDGDDHRRDDMFGDRGCGHARGCARGRRGRSGRWGARHRDVRHDGERLSSSWWSGCVGTVRSISSVWRAPGPTAPACAGTSPGPASGWSKSTARTGRSAGAKASRIRSTPWPRRVRRCRVRRWVSPKSRDGDVEAIRVLEVACRSATEDRIATLNQLRHLVHLRR